MTVMTHPPVTPTMIELDGDRPRLAAVLTDRHEPRHELLITADTDTNEITVKLFAGPLSATGRGHAAAHFPSEGTCCVLAIVELDGRVRDTDATRALDVSLAITWARDRVISETFDVAGTAIVYDDASGHSTRFDLVPGHPFNRFGR